MHQVSRKVWSKPQSDQPIPDFVRTRWDVHTPDNSAAGISRFGLRTFLIQASSRSLDPLERMQDAAPNRNTMGPCPPFGFKLLRSVRVVGCFEAS